MNDQLLFYESVMDTTMRIGELPQHMAKPVPVIHHMRLFVLV